MKLLKPNPIHYQLASDWKYIPASKTDIKKTIKKERDRLAKLIQEQKAKPNKIRELRTK